MNKIVIVNDEIVSKELDDSISVEYIENEFLSEAVINISSNADLMIDYTSTEETKLHLCFNLLEDVKCNLFELKKGLKYKLGYVYNLDKNSYVNVCKINDINGVKEQIIFNLNGDGSRVDYLLKTISEDHEKYDLMVYHNSSKTISNIINNGVNVLDGKLSFGVSGFVPNGIVDCELDQKNRIINLTNKKCEIKPNLFIDENDVVANHSAHIGKCNEDEMFYLMSRGIEPSVAENLIIKGFLLNGLKQGQNEMENIINKYWR